MVIKILKYVNVLRKKRKRFKCFFDIYIINEIKGVLV